MKKEELVKYHNDLNSLSMRNWSAEEMDLFFSVITKIRDKGTTLVTLDVDELKVLTGTETRNSYWFNMLDEFSEKAIQLHYREQTKHSKAIYNLFGSFKFNLADRSLRVSVTNDFEYIVNKLTANFTVYELAEFTSLKSTYAKTMYRILKQWKSLGEKEFKIEQFRELLDIPKSYTANNISQRVINPIQKELPQYFDNLKVKAIKRNTKGTPVIAYKFTWEPQNPSQIKYVPGKYTQKKKGKYRILKSEELKALDVQEEELYNIQLKKYFEEKDDEPMEGQIGFDLKP